MKYACGFCGKQFERFGHYQNHLKRGGCKPAVPKGPVAPDLGDVVAKLLLEVEELKVREAEREERCTKLVQDLGNMKRKLFFLEKTNAALEKKYQDILRTKKEIQQEEFINRLRNLKGGSDPESKRNPK